MCSTCILNIQKLKCKTIIDIETAGKQLETNKFNEQLTRDLESVEDHCKEKEKEIQRLIDGSHKERQDLKKYIEDFRNKMLTQFNKCEKDILVKVDERVKTQVAALTSQQTVLRETLQTAKENKDILQMIISNNSKADIFRCILSIMQQLDKSQTNKASVTTDMSTHSVELSPAFDTLLTSIDVHPIMQCRTVINTKTSTSNVNMKTDMDSFLETVKQVALTSENDLSSDYSCSSADAEMEDHEAKPHRIQSNESSNVSDTSSKSAQATASSHGTATKSKRLSNIVHMLDVTLTTPDEKQPCIAGIITLLDGSIVLSDSKHPRLIRVKEDLTYKDTADLSHLPGNMTVLNDKYLVVCLPTANRIAFVWLSPEFKWMRNFITKYTPKDVHALDTTRLLVSIYDTTERKWYLQILTTDGAFQQDLGKARSILDASQISSLKLTPISPRYYLQCCKESNKLYCFETSGKGVFKYSVMSPKCLYVDNAGKIYVLDSFGSVHILTNDGMLLQTIDVSKESNGIACNRKKDTLFITKQCSDKIGVFKISR
ncbi:uncharacterized protein LOC123547317 [Mercenaria mercenaria]|uniref:uncharacterized protein LOC123547317 n=1 Tax=Mercenaria mercenaria TaxID=6596 RepID=UPI00234FB035|nr:uncharacterized protein LOC123547317 [Mercenaria mercenaria]